MAAFFLMLLVVGLLIFAGVVISVRLYSQGALGTGRFRRNVSAPASRAI